MIGCAVWGRGAVYSSCRRAVWLSRVAPPVQEQAAPASWTRSPLCIEPDCSYEAPLAPAVRATAIKLGMAIKKRQQGWRFFMR